MLVVCRLAMLISLASSLNCGGGQAALGAERLRARRKLLGFDKIPLIHFVDIVSKRIDVVNSIEPKGIMISIRVASGCLVVELLLAFLTDACSIILQT